MTEYLDIVNTLISYDTEKEWFEFKENLDKADEVGKYISALVNVGITIEKIVVI
ncbi:MAG: hypothetical protein MRZ08_03635 [Anaerococcus sp.]|uniref:hypothetical protein n=1 Tax=Anaerococcus sp. TaxID=1872515 RepID=UPI002623548C|nr:hypothetical protein [Anaerococcus sp.]MCI5972109.1 hypothetical protein [Anaerococcus sp.]